MVIHIDRPAQKAHMKSKHRANESYVKYKVAEAGTGAKSTICYMDKLCGKNTVS